MMIILLEERGRDIYFVGFRPKMFFKKNDTVAKELAPEKLLDNQNHKQDNKKDIKKNFKVLADRNDRFLERVEEMQCHRKFYGNFETLELCIYRNLIFALNLIYLIPGLLFFVALQDNYNSEIYISKSCILVIFLKILELSFGFAIIQYPIPILVPFYSILIIAVETVCWLYSFFMSTNFLGIFKILLVGHLLIDLSFKILLLIALKNSIGKKKIDVDVIEAV